MIDPNDLTQSFLQTKQSESDQDDVKMAAPKIPVIVSSNDQRLLNGKQLVDLPSKNQIFFLMDGRHLMDVPIKIY